MEWREKTEIPQAGPKIDWESLDKKATSCDERSVLILSFRYHTIIHTIMLV